MCLTGISYSIDHTARLLNMTVEGVERKLWSGELPFFVDDEYNLCVRIDASDAEKFREKRAEEMTALLANDF
jgi:hypothetical protein